MSSSPPTHEETLEQWIERDLSAMAEKGELRTAFCIDDQLRQLDDIVSAGRAAVLVGDSGVGKSATIYELVRRMHLPPSEQTQFPRMRMMGVLANRRILQISLRRRASGLRQPHTQMGEEMLRLVDALANTEEPLALFFRDIDLAYQFNLETHFENLAFKFKGPVIAEGLRSTVQNMLEYHPELDQHFVTLVLTEPNLERMKTILGLWSDKHETDTGTRIDKSALQHALYLSHRFLSRSRMPRKALDLIEQVAATCNNHHVIVADVINRFCDNHRVPRDLVDPNIALDLNNLRGHFQERVLGQDEAVGVVIDVVGLIKAGMSDSRRPFGVFLFVGPTGVGKTHLAQLLAEFLFGDSERLLRINMADYSEPGKAETLFGNPNGTTPTMTRGVLAQRVSGHPFAVLLLDEFEKAHESVHDRLLQLMDEGSFINGAGETVSCRSMIIIATSNAGAEVYRSEFFGFAPQEMDLEAKDAELSRRLQDTFRFEFLNRFDRIVHFHPLSQDDIRTIAMREFDLIKERAGFAQRKLELDVEETLIDWISVQGYHPDFGARFLRRTIERHVATAIAAAIVRETPSDGATLTATVRLNKVVCYVSCEVESSTPVETPAPFMSQPISIINLQRDLDLESLRTQGRAVLEQGRLIFEDLRTKKSERKGLQAKMNQSSFWEHQGKRAEVLDRFREIEVVLRAEEHAAEAMERLREERDCQDDSAAGRWRLSQRIELAEASLVAWQRRQAERSRSSLWMMISCTEAQLPSEARIEELAALELAWCKRLGFDASVVGYCEKEARIFRVFLDIRGMGAKTFISMEQGKHCFARKDTVDLSCLCEIWDKGASEESSKRLRASRSRAGAFGLEIDCKSEVQLPSGETAEIVGQRSQSFSELIFSIDLRSSHVDDAVDTVARQYGHNGQGVTDPRTGITMARTRDVMAGNLDRFLEGWRQSS
ncbi:MAG: ATP-dependent Clp protease ATP-binding subunit [Myxococcales bacterium]|nr:ATP-dependent Clp protease ATP-binding subunit [Myxococcales bacterium]